MPVMCLYFFLTYHTFLFFKPLPISNSINLVRQIWQLQRQYFRRIAHTGPTIQCYRVVSLEPQKRPFSLTSSFSDSLACELLGYRSPASMSFFPKHLTSILLIVGIKKLSKSQFPFYIFNLLNTKKNGADCFILQKGSLS